jgi:flagellar L-ring protein precursor FlgH
MRETVMIRNAAVAVLAVLVAGCTQSAKEIGRAPYMSPVGTGISHEVINAYPQQPAPVKRFSLWSDKQSRLFTDARALSVGDILTVAITINDKASLKNQMNRTRDQSRSLGLGLTASTPQLGGIDVSGDLSGELSSGSASTGSGATARSESINLSVAAVVSQVLPNGNLIITGSQEVRVNQELRILTIAGIVRPSDIGASNTISYDRIAEARISYGGRGKVSDGIMPTYGQQALDAVMPF